MVNNEPLETLQCDQPPETITIDETFDYLRPASGAGEAEHVEYGEETVHGADGEVGEVYVCVDADEVEELVEDRRDCQVPEDEGAAADEHREEVGVEAEREEVAEE